MKYIVSIHLVGRFAVLILLLIQCGFLTAFPVWYADDLRWITVAVLYAPAVFYCSYCLKTTAELLRVFYTWFLYVGSP